MPVPVGSEQLHNGLTAQNQQRRVAGHSALGREVGWYGVTSLQPANGSRPQQCHHNNDATLRYVGTGLTTHSFAIISLSVLNFVEVVDLCAPNSALNY
ncbi:hypothetical protein J6590_002971 [Homalodisca vitripennis]|nr:hypothetical protein J6590_002969 [Homalodisca vitripennis]KAG8299002.1 hypothetical protein J6590_002971 [Homalodisca vitripennis]